MPLPFKVKAVFEYNSPHDDDLNFPNGQIITVTEEEDDEWYSGEYIDATGKKQEGIFPKNFVEKYEPEIPSRPARAARPKKETDSSHPSEPPLTPVAAPMEEEAPTHEQAAEPTSDAIPKQIMNQRAETPSSPPRTQSAVQRSVSSVTPKSPPQPAPKPAVSKLPPPQVAEKPSGGSFRDRIAAFNKPTASPVAPLKPGVPGGTASTGFIKKPFVAPPPSKNAYLPPPREAPQKFYRREEDPSLVAEQKEEAEIPAQRNLDDEGASYEDQPKPTSLRDRIALLQKQQLEQAARHAESLQKKEKPKRPPKKHAESQEKVDSAEPTIDTGIERVETNETIGKKSIDFADDERGPLRGPSSRQATGHSYMATPPQPSRELMSDTNDADYSAAGDTEEAEEISTEEEKPKMKRRITEENAHTGTRAEVRDESADKGGDNDEKEDDAEEAEEDEEVDPEIRRRMELRDRMAKMSGGMGMMGMFGPMGGMPPSSTGKKTRASTENERHISSGYDQTEAMARAPPVPLIPLPGMTRPQPSEVQKPEQEDESETEGTAEQSPAKSPAPRDLNEAEDLRPQPLKRSGTEKSTTLAAPDRAVPPPHPRDMRGIPPPPPTDRPVPAALSSPNEVRSPPLPPPRTVTSPGIGEDSDDEGPLEHSGSSLNQPSEVATNAQSQGQPKGSAPVPPSRPGIIIPTPTSPTGNDKRLSRGPPPIPVASPTLASPSQARGPPPPPPGQPPSRRSTNESRNLMSISKHQVDDDSEEEVTEYDGDYDTDIASSAKHKDALKSHGRDSSVDEGTITDEAVSLKSPTIPPIRIPPPLPPTSAPRDVHPPPPQTPKTSRKSTDIPRSAPPPIPTPKELHYDEPNEENEYDPYRYSGTQIVSSPVSKTAYAPALQSPEEEFNEDNLYSAPPVTQAPPPPPLAERSAPAPPNSIPITAPPNPPRQSLDISRQPTVSRRSMDNRNQGEQGLMATDIDLAQKSFWWTQENTPPPSLRNRSDILVEIESSTSSKRGGKTTVSRDVYVLYLDYSQTTISASFDSSEPSNVTFEQRHERPPPPLRQDQLESASGQFGARIANAMHSKLNVTVGDGTPHSLILELLRPLVAEALLPIGSRSYGAIVYSNLANASTQQMDEIRPGDIVTLRNAKFAGHKGTMHAKYFVDVGKPDHVAIVLDWDGTKKKIRVWEQGRDVEGKGKKGKVKEESYKMGDLKSGEVRVWRVMGRRWVGWESQK